MAQGKNVREVGDRIEGLLEDLRAMSDERTRAKAEELVSLLVELYGAGLERIVEIASEDQSGNPLLRMAEDPLVESLLVLHGLHPVPVETRITEALDTVRPYLGSHAGGVEFLGVDDEGRAHLRLEGSCNGCPSSTITVKLAIERAIEEAAPEIVSVEVDGVTEEPAEAPALLQIGRLGTASGAEPNGGGPGAWTPLEGLGGLLPGQMRSVEVAGLGVLVCSAGGTLYAYRNACARCDSALEAGTLQDELLSCPSCAAGFDVRLAGRSVDDHTVHLDPIPLLEHDGGWRIAVVAGAG